MTQPVVEAVGQITIAPRVLTTIVAQNTLNTEGVLSLAARLPKRTRKGGQRASAPGIEVIVTEGVVSVVLHILATPQANLVELAKKLQSKIAHALEHIAGLQTSGVDVYIDNVSSAKVEGDKR